MVRAVGVYELRVMVDCGGKWTKATIVVDSGAEECVMPEGMFPEVPSFDKKHGVRFMGADGSDLANFGRKLLEFVPVKDVDLGFPRRA